MALKEVFGASALTNSQDCPCIFCVLESETLNNIVTVRRGLYFTLFILFSFQRHVANHYLTILMHM